MLPFFRGSIPDEVLLFDEVLQETYGPRVHWLQFPFEWTQMNHEIHGIEWGPSTSNNNNNKTFGDLKVEVWPPSYQKNPHLGEVICFLWVRRSIRGTTWWTAWSPCGFILFCVERHLGIKGRISVVWRGIPLLGPNSRGLCAQISGFLYLKVGWSSPIFLGV